MDRTGPDPVGGHGHCPGALHLGLKLTYHPGTRTMGAEIALDAQSWGYGLCPEGDLNPHALYGH